MSKRAEGLACTLLFAGVVMTGGARASVDGASGKAASSQPVYYDGKVVEITYAPGKRDFNIGPWKLAARAAREKPRDPRPNFYIVAPGQQYTAEDAPEYDHNEVLSTVFVKPEVRDWDVYWAIVLDPSLQEDFRSEKQLIMATQNTFAPQADFDFDSIPGAQFLREFLKIDSLEGLAQYRRPDGLLPRLIIVPAGISIRGEAVDPDAPKDKSGEAQTRSPQ